MIDVNIYMMRQKYIAHLLPLPICRDVVCCDSQKWPFEWALPAIQSNRNLCSLRQIRKEPGLNTFVKDYQVATNVCSVRYVGVRPQHKHGFPKLSVLNGSEWEVWGYQKNYQLLSPSRLGEYRNVLSIRVLCILLVCTFSLENHQLTTSNCDKSA